MTPRLHEDADTRSDRLEVEHKLLLKCQGAVVGGGRAGCGRVADVLGYDGVHGSGNGFGVSLFWVVGAAAGMYCSPPLTASACCPVLQPPGSRPPRCCCCTMAGGRWR